jgi:hypothetical protein
MSVSQRWQRRSGTFRWRAEQARGLPVWRMAWAAHRLATEQRAEQNQIAGKDWRRNRWCPPPKQTIRLKVWWPEDELDDLANSFMADLSQD